MDDIIDLDQEEEEVEDISLDNNWIKEYEILDKEYETFYKEDVDFIRIHYVYVNSENDIEKIKEDKLHMLNSNYISRDELLGILKRNSIVDKKKYTVLSIVKYNIDIEPVDVKEFLFDKKTHKENPFLCPIKNIDAIPLNKTITMFHDLNDLFIIFYENPDKMNYIKARNSPSNNCTRKVYISLFGNKRKKTLRKQLK